MKDPPAPSAGAGVVRTPVVFGVPLDRLDDQVQFVRAVDLSRHAILAWRDLVGFGEVVQAVGPREWVLHEERDTSSVFCPREQEQAIGAEVERAPEIENSTVD
jgi:hypothetical protein